MNDSTKVYVRLLGEAIDAWRPVQAEHLHDNVYRIADQTYDQEIETWQFGPGDIVICELTELSNGVVLAAIQQQE